MEGDEATVGTILSRSEALSRAAEAGILLYGGAAFSGLARSARSGRPLPHLVVCPELSQPPAGTPPDLQRSNLISASNRLAVRTGLPLVLNLSVALLSGGAHRAVENARVDIWQADAAGDYSPERPASGDSWLRGYQLTDDCGDVRFLTIFPGWYAGRTPHIHFKVRAKVGEKLLEFTSQLFFSAHDIDYVYCRTPYREFASRDTDNDRDPIFNQHQSDGSVAGQYLTLHLAANPAGAGYAAQFTILLTEPSCASDSGCSDPRRHAYVD